MNSIMPIQEIQAYLPHRYPFLLVDGVLELDPGERIVGFKNTTLNEPFYQGHFPENPIMPGVLIIESLAQITAIMYGSGAKKKSSEDEENGQMSEHVGYLAGIEHFRFKGMVVPGDTILLYASLEEKYANIMKVKVTAKVERRLIAQGTITVTSK